MDEYKIILEEKQTVMARYEVEPKSGEGYQSEAQLENALIKQLADQGYEYAKIKDEAALLENLRQQLQALNDITLSDSEWARLLPMISNEQMTILDKTEMLQGKGYILDLKLDNSSSNYDLVLLKKIIEKESNKHLHADEQCLLIGFINNMLYQIYKRSSARFNNLKHRYALAYKEWVKPVIGVDEATDFSILDYYLICSFRHYQFNSITLCGDIMQGITENGINDWNDLKWILPELTKKELKVSYRQTPTLVKLAREMYKDEVGNYPSYQSDKDLDEDNEPAPIACVSDDEEEKAEWIAKRIIEVYKIYDSKMPSVAVFVGDEVNVSQFINTIYDTDLLNGIDVVDCTGGRALNRSDIVRVFRISEVKGMEFEVAFFYNLDEALHGRETGLMKKYLYVGLSRATTHLAATFCSPDKARDVLTYFDIQDNNWKI